MLCAVSLCDVSLCDVLLCAVLILHYTSSVTRKIASQLPLILHMTIFSFFQAKGCTFPVLISTLGAARMDAPPKPSLDDPGDVETWAPWDDAALEDGNRCLGMSWPILIPDLSCARCVVKVKFKGQNVAQVLLNGSFLSSCSGVDIMLSFVEIGTFVVAVCPTFLFPCLSSSDGIS